ncbi:MAG: TniQ family protein [Chryseotalea sp.]|nr:TniQ family protein [Cyclobacteriaceae bacterium]
MLPFATKPLHNEILSSWLVRIAKNHFLEPKKFTAVFFKDKYFWTLDIDKSISEIYLNKLAESTTVDNNLVSTLTLRSFIPFLSIQFSVDQTRSWFNRIQRTKGRISSNSYLYCPNCLKTDEIPYMRKEWRIYLFTTCIHCKCLLEDSCPHCKSPIQHFNHNSNQLDKTFDYIRFCAVCKNDLTTVHPRIVETSQLNNQKFIYDLIYQGFDNQFNYSHLFFEGLYQMYCSLLTPQNEGMKKFLDSKFSDAENAFHLKKIIDIPLDKRAILINQCVELTRNWPINLLEFCKENKIKYFELIRRKREYPYWYFSELRKNLFVGNPTKRTENKKI